MQAKTDELSQYLPLPLQLENRVLTSGVCIGGMHTERSDGDLRQGLLGVTNCMSSLEIDIMAVLFWEFMIHMDGCFTSLMDDTRLYFPCTSLPTFVTIIR